MKEIIALYEHIIIEITTPYSTGTGFYLRDAGLIITNEHVVRDNRTVVIHGKSLPRQLTPVLFTDMRYDLAFLEVPTGITLPSVRLATDVAIQEGDPVVAIGHPFGLKISSTQGIVSNTDHEMNDVLYIQHDAALNPGNSGGPLVNLKGEVIGINTFIIRDGNSLGFSLPAATIQQAISDFVASGGTFSTRCFACLNIVKSEADKVSYCPSCGAAVVLPNQAEAYETVGVAHTIEDILHQTGHIVELSRRGPNNWEIQQGSAQINISYHEPTGLISGDAYLCSLPKSNIAPLYEFLLRQNYTIEGLSFSICDQDIILSLMIFDRYLNVESGVYLFKHLFEKADSYDNLLIEQFGAQWKTKEKEDH